MSRNTLVNHGSPQYSSARKLEKKEAIGEIRTHGRPLLDIYHYPLEHSMAGRSNGKCCKNEQVMTDGASPPEEVAIIAGVSFVLSFLTFAPMRLLICPAPNCCLKNQFWGGEV